MMLLYRYRTYDNAVRELQDQTIYFADRNETNDPDMEGIMHIYWQGDAIAWQGLFKNYICSLQLSLFQYLVDPHKDQISKNPIAISDVKCFRNVPLGEIFEHISNQFLSLFKVHNTISYLEKNNIALARNDLILLLRMLHIYATRICVNALKEFMPKNFYSYLMTLISSAENYFENEFPNNEDKVNEEQLVKLNKNNKKFDDAIKGWIAKVDDEERKNLIHWMWDFPDHYVKNLDEFIHPKAYVACFSTNDNNSQMWGNYADNFNGVCMIYETHKVQGKEKIVIEKPYSESSSGVSKRYQDMELYKVKYGGELQEVNFFSMLGQFNGKQLYSWLADDDGNQSKCLRDIYDDIDTWRKKYWDCLIERYCRKTKEWESENEYRLLLIASFFNYEKKESRILKYSFSDLRGVVLGSHMSPENREKILDIIRTKCEQAGRRDFEVYLLEADTLNGTITRRPYK